MTKTVVVRDMMRGIRWGMKSCGVRAHMLVGDNARTHCGIIAPEWGWQYIKDIPVCRNCMRATNHDY